MTAPVWLIAEREIRTYVATASFWIALAVGPLAAGGVFLISGGHAPLLPVQVHAGNATLTQSAAAALEQAGRLEGRHFAFGGGGANLVLSNISSGTMVAHFGADFPLSATGRALVIRTLERDAARRAANSPSLVIRETNEGTAASKPDAAALCRFSLMMLLWLTLTGSLGMLLQSVVRERANCALESLLAAARPWEIMVGKLAGVGAISLAVLAAWLGPAAALATLLPSSSDFVPVILSNLAAQAVLSRAALVYVLAYAFYGSVTIGLGAMARDVAAAQNLSRPMFVVLLAAFFIALVSTASGQMMGLSWLIFVPPFAPFMLLLRAPTELPLVSQALSLSLLLAAALLAGFIAIGRISLLDAGRGRWIFLAWTGSRRPKISEFGNID